MHKSLAQTVREYIKKHLRQKRWRRVVTALACAVALCTFYALILPAITLTDDTGDAPDLAEYLTDVDITVDGEAYEEGDTISPTKEFAIKLQFSGISGRNGKTTYTYTLPENIGVQNNITDGILKDPDGVQQGTYTVIKDEESGLTTVGITFYEDYVNSNDYMNLGLEISAKWESGGDGEYSIDFGNNHVKKIIVDSVSKMSIEKTHKASDDRNAEYSIIVTADTAQSDVRLSDSISFGEIYYTDSDGVQHTESLGAQLKTGGTITAVIKDKNGTETTLATAEVQDQESLNTFLTDLGSNLDMDAGDTLTVSYPMEYPLTSTFKADVYGCTLNTTNTASVYSDEIPDQLTATEKWSYYGSKNHIIQKEAAMQDDHIKWDLTINDGGNIPMAGTEISDALQSEALSYDLTKSFVIDVYESNGTLIRTDTITDWTDNTQGLALSADGRSWTYTVPSSDGENRYVYLISYYTTIVDNSAKQLNNAAGARFSQFQDLFGGEIGVGTETNARNIELEIQKEGQIVDQENRIVEWTIKYMVLPGSGEIEGFALLDNMPKYTVNGETKYAKLIDSTGAVVEYNSGDVPVDTSKNGTGVGDVFSLSISPYTAASGDTATPDYSTDEFEALKDFAVYYWDNGGEQFGFTGSVYDEEKRNDFFTLPAAVGDYADGYVATIKYKTKSEGIVDGDYLTNYVSCRFKDLKGKERWLDKNARVRFDINDREDSVSMDKTGQYDSDNDKVHYTVDVDTEHVGFGEAGYVAITDTYDSRLSFSEDSYNLRLEANGESVTVPIYAKEYGSWWMNTEQVETPSGFTGTTWKTTFRYLEAFAEHDGVIEQVENFSFYTIVDDDNHTFTLYMPCSYMAEMGTEYVYFSYRLDYDLIPVGTGSEYKDVYNIVTATDNNGTRFGKAETTFSFAKYISKKTLTDSASHEHDNTANCYTFKYNENSGNWEWTQTCQLSDDDKNTVLFKIQVDLSAAALSDQSQLIIDDYMDSSSLTPDVENLQLRFVHKDGEKAITFDDVCAIAEIADASYTVELTASGLTVNINLGQKDGQNYTVDTFCEAFKGITWFANMVGEQVDLRDWKLELSYPAEVKGVLGETVTVTNKANLRGISDSNSEVTYDKVIESSGGSVSGQSYTLNVWKIDSMSTGGQISSLSNVGFALFDKDGTQLASAVTGEDGKIAFGTKGTAGQCTLQAYTPYYLIETDSPTGYVHDTTKHWFYFMAPEGTQEQKNFTDEQKDALEALGCVPMKMDSTIQIINSKTASFKIKKTDSDSGEALAGAEFKLYSDSACQTEVQVSHTSGDGIYLLDGLTLGNTYYLKETTAPTGYEPDENVHAVTVDAEGAVSIPDAAEGEVIEWNENELAYVYKNEKKQYGILLPETGGAGTHLFTIGGMLLTAGGLLLGYSMRRKRKKKI